jgi:hypothetical protein
MIDRRGFMQTIAIAATTGWIDAHTFAAATQGTWRPFAGAASGIGQPAGGEPAREEHPPAAADAALALFDRAIEPSRAFAAHLARGGAAALDIGDDIGALWYRAIAPRTLSAQVTVAGLTRASDCFVVEQLCIAAGASVQRLAVKADSAASGATLWHALALWRVSL